MTEFGRVLTAMATPFDDWGRVDYERAKQLALALLDSGTDGLVLAGTTGESPTLSTEEKMRLFSEVRSAIGNRGSIVAGTCNYNTAESIELSKEAARHGVDGILGTVPYYNKPPQEGLYAHFKKIAESVDLPFILYNVPTRTVTNMAPETTIRLSRIENIIGLKDAGGNLDATSMIVEESAPGFRVWSGDDSSTLPILAVGGYGIVSVASHLIGRQIQTMIQSFIEGRNSEAAEIHRRTLPLIKALFVTTSPIPLKYALDRVGFSVGSARLPLVEIDSRSAEIMDQALANSTIDLPVPVGAAAVLG